jgi:hypothetical protein
MMSATKLSLADESPEAFTIKTGSANDKVRSIDNYMLSELVKTQKGYNQLLDSIQEQEKKLSMIETAIKSLHDSEKENPKEKRLEEKQVTLVLSSNKVKSSALMAGGAVIERPISNAMHNFYTPISSGTYGTLLGLVAMGVTYKKTGWEAAVAQGYFIGGVSQMIQDLMTYLATQPGFSFLGGLGQ